MNKSVAISAVLLTILNVILIFCVVIPNISNSVSDLLLQILVFFLPGLLLFNIISSLLVLRFNKLRIFLSRKMILIVSMLLYIILILTSWNYRTSDDWLFYLMLMASIFLSFTIFHCVRKIKEQIY